MHTGFVYMMTNKTRTALYVGVTNSLVILSAAKDPGVPAVRARAANVRLAAACFVALLMAWGGPGAAAPQIGYAYPAGGTRGATFIVEVGGQSLRDVDGVRVSGKGVHASVVEYVPPLTDEERDRTERFLRDLVRRRWSVSVMNRVAKETNETALPDHPWLREIDGKSPNELNRLRTRLFDPKSQPNVQIGEQVVIEVAIDADAQAGDRELRLASYEGLSNPLCFQVGTLPEFAEKDAGGGGAAPILQPPLLLNGQVAPGEVDRARLRARRGQKLVMCLQARRLIPYLADAVPGWFQATLALRGPDGAEVAWSDDYRFDPDPVLLYEVPADGVYKLEVRDAIYRGRDDFVYRLAVGELPFVTRVFPLGGQAGARTTAAIQGWNLPVETLPLDTSPGPAAIRLATVGRDQGFRSEVCYAVNAPPEVTETEPNDTAGTAQPVAFPLTVNGRIGRPGDTDVFRFEGRSGQEFVAEVYARRLNAPLDSVLSLTDSNGTEVAFNDDHKDPEMGLLTHQADSYVRVKLPHDGAYRVTLSDAQNQGSEAHAYRLQLRPAQPDFALRLAPSCVNVQAGETAPFTAQVLRKDGFDGEVALALVDAPAGFALGNATIPAGTNVVAATLRAPPGVPRQVFPIRVEGRAVVGGVAVSHAGVAAEDMMQAFLWRFLVPRQELLVAVRGARSVPAVWRPLAPGFRVASPGPVRIPRGGAARVELAAPPVLPDDGRTPLATVQFRLCNRPRGVTFREASAGGAGVSLTLKADPNIALAGDTAYAIVEAFVTSAAESQDGPTANRTQRVALGVLPAIAYEIVQP